MATFIIGFVIGIAVVIGVLYLVLRNPPNFLPW